MPTTSVCSCSVAQASTDPTTHRPTIPSFTSKPHLYLHPPTSQSAVPGMEFLAKVIHLNYDVKSLISLGAMDAALAALKNHKGVVAVVPPTMRALRAIAETGNAQCKQVWLALVVYHILMFRHTRIFLVSLLCVC